MVLYINENKFLVGDRIISPFIKKFNSRTGFFQIMIFSSVGVIVLLQLCFTEGFPLHFKDYPAFDNSTSSPYVSRDDIKLQQQYIQALVNSSVDVFSQIEGGTTQGSFFDSHNNVVGSNFFQELNQYQRQPYVANGYIGSRIPNLGQGFTYDQSEYYLNNYNGWPLFNQRYLGAFMSGFYNIEAKLNLTNFPELYANGYESVIAAIPQWTTLTLSVELDNQNYTLDPSDMANQGDITDYMQTLSLENGIATTLYTWMDQLHVQYEVLAHRKDIHLGLVRLQVLNLENSPITVVVTDTLDFATAQRCQFVNTTVSTPDEESAIGITFQPHELDYINGVIYSRLKADNSTVTTQTNQSVSQLVSLVIGANQAVEVTKLVGIASTDIDPDSLTTAEDVFSLAKSVVSAAYRKSESYLFTSHVDTWDEILDIGSVNITFPNDTLLTLVSRASLYHLAANTRPQAQGVTAAMGVGGLSSDSYAGMVFWDTDIWMSGGILPFLPEHAKSFVNYRLHTHEQAKENIPTEYNGEYGAVYPWTSGRFGNCTSTGPCFDYEYHINVAIAYGAWQLYLSGAGDDEYLKSAAAPLIEDAATFLSSYLAKYNSTYDKYTTHNLTDPDEFANHIDNGAYTNAGIQETLNWAVALCNHFDSNCTSKYQDVLDKGMYLPSSDNADDITLEYSGMNSSIGVKQADVILMSYPLDSNLINEDQATSNLKYYAAKQVTTGPAMTFPIFSAVSAKLSTSGCSSQSYLHRSIQPFLRAPFAQFLEQNNDDFATNGGTHPAFPFMTAHGGILQAVLGLTGLKFDYTTSSNSSAIQRVLRLDPIALPCLGSGGLEITGIKYMNQTLDIVIGTENFTLRHNGPSYPTGSSPTDIHFYLGSRNSLSNNEKVQTLASYEEISIPLYKPAASIIDSISECGDAIFTNITMGSYGDVPQTMNDGDNSTFWQVQNSLTLGLILIDLKDYRNLSRGVINWGARPAKSFSLSSLLSNSTDEVVNEILDIQTDHKVMHNLQQHFKGIYDEDVAISAPFNSTQYDIVELGTQYNISSFSLDAQEARFLLLEVTGVLDKNTDITNGATINEVLLFVSK